MVSREGTGAVEKLLNDSWDYHDRESERLARELEAAATEGVPSKNLAPFLHISTHTIGEHLGDWARALKLGKCVLDRRTPTFETARAWGWLYVAAVLAGDAVEAVDSELSYLRAAAENFGMALLDMRFMLVGALVGSKRTSEGASLYRNALDLVGQIRQSAFLDRTIAVASNNLGWELYEMSQRTPSENTLMQLCAAMSLKFWLQCGDWINEERALYFKALVSNITGSPESALADADKALAVINAQGERPLDAALLHLARASSLAALGDTRGRLRAIADADAAASKLTLPALKAQFAAERAKLAVL
jgi:hypothetical protein